MLLTSTRQRRRAAALTRPKLLTVLTVLTRGRVALTRVGPVWVRPRRRLFAVAQYRPRRRDTADNGTNNGARDDDRRLFWATPVPPTGRATVQIDERGGPSIEARASGSRQIRPGGPADTNRILDEPGQQHDKPRPRPWRGLEPCHFELCAVGRSRKERRAELVQNLAMLLSGVPRNQ